jgi:hypothetical protein
MDDPAYAGPVADLSWSVIVLIETIAAGAVVHFSYRER